MSQKIFSLVSVAILCLFVAPATAQDKVPTINPTFIIIDENGEQELTDYEGQAPLMVRFRANAEDVGVYRAFYEWRFYKEGGSPEKPYLTRTNPEGIDDTELTLSESGRHCAVVYATFINGTDTIRYDYENYWADASPLSIVVKESKLEFPNAFSPNGDGINDIYRAKEGWQSIVSFKATIFNRWGQKIYEWNNPDGGWDGTFHGSNVKDGVYFVHVEARGADGVVYDIRRDVNLLRGFTQKEGGMTE